MSGIGASAAALIIQQSRHAVTLRRPNSISSAVLSAGALSGAATVSLKSASAQKFSPNRRGVVKGSVFSIAGVAGSYAVLADVEIPASGVLPISIFPVLAGPASLGVAVTFSQGFKDWTYPVINRKATAEDKEAVEGGRQVRILPFIADKPAPEQNDRIDGFPILEVDTVEAEDQVAYYRCFIGSAP